jgi:hypothetical protein
MTKSKTTAGIDRSTGGLVDALFEELDGMKAGTVNPSRANAVAKLAGTILDTKRLEMEAERHLERSATASTALPQTTPGCLRLGAA